MKALAEQINELDGVEIYGVEIYGRVVGVRGLMVAGPIHAMSVGARVVIEISAKPIPCEVVGFAGGNALLMPFAPLEGVRRGCRATVYAVPGAVRPAAGWLGGGQRHGRAARPRGAGAQHLHHLLPRPAHGIFSGSGVGKSVLLSMLARDVASGVSVIGLIGLIGERGREVQEFLQDDLGEAGLARSVVVVATSDELALMRR